MHWGNARGGHGDGGNNGAAQPPGDYHSSSTQTIFNSGYQTEASSTAPSMWRFKSKVSSEKLPAKLSNR